MEERNCLTCKYVSNIIENKKNPMKSTIYCEKAKEIFLECDPCSCYQKRSSKDE